MKTIAIFSGYSLPHLGGIERYVSNLSNELVKDNINVLNISSNYQFKDEYYFKKNNIEYFLLPVYNLFIRRYPLPKHNKIYKKIIEALDEHKIDAIIVNTRFHLTSLIGAKYGHKRNIPVFLIEHGSQHLTVNNKFLDFFGAIYEHLLTKVVEKYVNYNFGVSKAATEWQKHFKINSDGIWYNSINDFSNKVKLQKKYKSKINVLYSGRILKQKGILKLIEVFEKIEKKYSNVYLTLAGDGELYDKIGNNYNNDRHINFIGKVDFEELKKLYSKCDIFVYVPIWPEGLPTSILEAGLMECAIIATPQGGIKEIINNNENGLLINNSKQLYSALKLLIEDEKKRNILAKEIKKTINSKFLWTVTAKKIENDIEKRIVNE